MNWEAISTSAEIIGATLVIVSVIYLAQQVRQNTATARTDALRTIKLELSKQYIEMGLNERVSKLMHRMVYEERRRSEFSDADKQSIAFIMLARVYVFDAAFRSFQEGILKEAEVLPMMTSRIWKLPFVVDSWPIFAMELSPDFVAYMENNFDNLVSTRVL